MSDGRESLHCRIMGTKNAKTFRFIIGSLDGPHSSDWCVKIHKESAYFFGRLTGQAVKFSFHDKQICRYATTQEMSRAVGHSTHGHDRCIQEWKRAVTPSIGSGKASLALSIGFPSDFLSSNFRQITGDIENIYSAPKNMTTVIDLFFVNENEKTFNSLIEGSGRTLEKFMDVDTGEHVAVTSRHASYVGEEICVPPGSDEERMLVFPYHDPESTGRPVRLMFCNEPHDNCEIICWEMGGFWAANDFPIQEMHSINRSSVFQRTCAYSS